MNRHQWNLVCPIPIDEEVGFVCLAHGEGARLSRQLIAEHILPRLRPAQSPEWQDAGHLCSVPDRVAVTTDSFVVSPLFFPGGDIGSLSVHGTVNDLAVSGAIPRWMTVSLIIEEGLPLTVLDTVLDSLATAALECGVAVVAGDTKVVPRGAADGLFITTTGIGELVDPVPAGPASIQPGDVLIVSGPIGRHGIAVLCARENLGFSPPPRSDSAPLIDAVQLIRDSGGNRVRTIRDATRGGVSAVLHEWSEASVCSFVLEEAQIPVSPDVRGACEVLGLDPLYIACEGTLVAVVDAVVADRVVSALRSDSRFHQACTMGGSIPKRLTPVSLRRSYGTDRAVDEPTGALLPRIC